MKIDNDYYTGSRSTTRIILGCIGTLFSISLVLFIVLYSNQDKWKKKPQEQPSAVSDAGEINESLAANGEGRTSDDLDFWDMYNEVEVPLKSTDNMEYDKELVEEILKETKDDVSGNKVSANSISGNTVSGNTFNAGDDKNKEPVEINPDIPKNTYTVNGFRQENEKLEYYSNNRKISSFGIDVSKYQGQIDWEKVKAAGVEFAMIRMGVRGYSSGTVVIDESYVANMEGAIANGIGVGIYFYSQATTKEEAVEEANYAVSAASKYTLTYPIVFYSEEIENDTARTDGLSKEQLTEVAQFFCDTVKAYGYKPMICASKKRLATAMNIENLKSYDIWLVDAPIPAEGQRLSVSEYPYQYTMWQYSSNGKIDGIPSGVDLDISFVDYKYR